MSIGEGEGKTQSSIFRIGAEKRLVVKGQHRLAIKNIVVECFIDLVLIKQSFKTQQVLCKKE